MAQLQLFERLSIDEIIEHCDRHTSKVEKHYSRAELETLPLTNDVKMYWEHKQVANYLRQLKAYKEALK